MSTRIFLAFASYRAHHFDADWCETMKNEAAENGSLERLTVSLGRGQRKNLEDIARLNDMKLAQVVRLALSRFILENQGKQISLRFPKEIES